MSVFRLAMRLGFTGGGGGGGEALELSLGTLIVPSASVEDDNVGSFTSSNGDGTYTDTNQGDTNFLAPEDIFFSSLNVDNESVAGTKVSTISESRSNQSKTFTITADPDDMFELDGDGDLALTDTVDFLTDPSHNVTIEVETAAGQTFSKTVTIDVNFEAPLWSITAEDSPNTVSTTTGGATMAIGDTADDRFIIVAFGKGAGPVGTATCTINGTNAPEIVARDDDEAVAAYLFGLLVTTGTTANIVVTHSSTNRRALQVIRLTNVSSLTPTDTAAPIDDTGVIPLNVDTPSGASVIISVAVVRSASQAATWVGTDEIQSVPGNNFENSVAIVDASGAETDRTVSVDFSGTDKTVAVTAVFQ